MTDLPRVLLENYLMLAAALENQNLGRMQDMLQYQQKVQQNLLDVMQHIEDAPAVAMTTSSRQPAQQTNWQEQRQGPPPTPGQPAGSNYVRCGMQHAAHIDTSEQEQQQQQQQQPDPLFLAPQPPHPHQRQQQAPVPPWPTQQQQPQQQQQHAQPDWLRNIDQPVGELLRGLGLQEFEALLQQQAVDLAALQLMQERHLRELGLPIGAVVKLRAALAAMNASNTAH